VMNLFALDAALSGGAGASALPKFKESRELAIKDQNKNSRAGSGNPILPFEKYSAFGRHT